MPKPNILIAGGGIGGLAAAGCLLQAGYDVEVFEQAGESWTSKHSWHELKADFAGWHEDIQALIDLADRNDCYRWALHIRAPIQNWNSGRVTLLGDAANRGIFYTDSVDELRAIFAKRNMGKERNNWLYSYNPLDVKLV